MIDDASRRSAAVAASLALHAAVAALVIGRGVVQLTLTPAPILLSLVEASDRTAGPGEASAQLRSAAPTVVQPSESSAAAPVVHEKAAEPEPEPVPVAKPRPVAKTIEHPKPSAPIAAAESATAAIQRNGSATGSVEESGTGTGAHSSAPAWAATARVRYEELLFAWMDRHKQYPMLAQRRGLQGSGLVRVRIDRNGHVIDRALDRSTGEPMLDEAALDMVRRANPFPAVPDEYAGASFEFVAPVEYRLR